MLDLPGIFYYHDVKHEIVAPRTFTVTVAAKTTGHPLYGYGSPNGYYMSGDKYGSVTQSPAISMSRGLTYTFNQDNITNATHAIYFSESEDAYGGIKRYEKGVVYRINGDIVPWTEYNSQFTAATTRSIEITPSVNSPDTLYYVCQIHLAMGNAISVKSDITNSRFFNVINDPVLGTHSVFNVPNQNNYFTGGVNYTNTNTVFLRLVMLQVYHTLYKLNIPDGGIATITIGDNGRNYQSLPKLLGSTRSGSGATAMATISGGLSNVSVTNHWIWL